MKKFLVKALVLIVLALIVLGACYFTRVTAMHDTVTQFCETRLPSLISESLSTPFVHRVSGTLSSEESGLKFDFEFDPSVAPLMTSLVSEYYNPNLTIPLNVDVSLIPLAQVEVAKVVNGLDSGVPLDDLLFEYVELSESYFGDDADPLEMQKAVVAGLVLQYDFGQDSGYQSLHDNRSTAVSLSTDGSKLVCKASSLDFVGGVAYVEYAGFEFSVYSTVSGIAVSSEDIPRWDCMYLNKLVEGVSEAHESLTVDTTGCSRFTVYEMRYTDGGGNFKVFYVTVGYNLGFSALGRSVFRVFISQ